MRLAVTLGFRVLFYSHPTLAAVAAGGEIFATLNEART
jgi:hypothetical protein